MTEQPAKPSKRPSVWEIFYPGNVSGHREAIYLASFPPIIYFWPTMFVCFFCAFFQGIVGVNPVTLGWLMVVVTLLNFLVLVQDFDQKQFIILILSLLAFFLVSWIITLYGFHFLTSIVGWIFAFAPALSTDAYLVLGTALLIFFAWGMVTPLFSYWVLEQNEFIHFSQPVGRDMSIARAGCSIYKEVPDIFECILSGGGGTLVIRRDDQILATIPNIPFLGTRMKAIEHLLSETRVVIENS